MEKLRKAFGACLVPLLSILLAFLIELIEGRQQRGLLGGKRTGFGNV